MVEYLPHVNVSLNAITTLLLIAGLVCIKNRQELWHGRAMYMAFATSCLFLICYLFYHYHAGSKKFPTDPDVAPVVARYFYYFVLLTHVLLAATVPFFAIAAIYAGVRDMRTLHKRIVRFAWPIWFYVSVTGIVVYAMLYQIYLPPMQ